MACVKRRAYIQVVVLLYAAKLVTAHTNQNKHLDKPPTYVSALQAVYGKQPTNVSPKTQNIFSDRETKPSTNYLFDGILIDNNLNIIDFGIVFSGIHQVW